MSANWLKNDTHGRVTELGGPPRKPERGNMRGQDPPSSYRDFYGRDFLVTPDVLIPRPETEQLIDAVLNLAGKPYLPGVKPSPRQLPGHPKILDVGTGSGCIAITLALELPDAEITATDISEKALQIAQKNAKNLGVATPISFIISYLLQNVNSNYDLIIANLPYVDETWDWLDKTALAKEPTIALYAEDGGLALIKELIAQAAARRTKYLVLESDPCQHDALANYALGYGYGLVKVMGYIQVYRKQK